MGWDGLTENSNFYGEVRVYFRPVWTAVYRAWVHLILAPKLGKPGKELFVKGNIDVSCKCFSFLTFQIFWHIKEVSNSYMKRQTH